MKDINSVEQKIRELKGYLKEEFYVKKIGYFGSYARGEYTSSSDIDILVEFSKPLGWKFFELQDFLESKLNMKVDLVTKNALKKQLKDQILKEVHAVE
jgi:hypothetical protein